MLFMYSPAGMEAMFPEIGKPGRRGVAGPPLARRISPPWPAWPKSTFSYITP